MKAFFETTKETLNTQGFDLFSIGHLLWLICIGIGIYLFARIFKTQDKAQQKKTLRLLAWTILGLEIIRDLLYIVTGHFTLDMLPLHLCGLNIFFIFYHSYKPSNFLSEWLFAASLPGALLALLLPDWSVLPFFTYYSIHSFVIHGLLMCYPILLVVGGYKPNYKLLGKCMMLFIGIAVSLFVINQVLHTNYMLMRDPGEGTPLTMIAGIVGIPAYTLAMPVLVALVWCVQYGIVGVYNFYQSIRNKPAKV